MTRQQRRRAEREARRAPRRDGEKNQPMARADLLRIFAALVECDPTLSGATIFSPDGQVDYIDAAMLRRGGRA